MIQLRLLWENLRASLWFVPTLIVTGAVVLAAWLIEIDIGLDVAQLPTPWPHILAAGVDGARGMLVAIASSMITVAGTTFSITIVVLALASSQYTSRILRNFMRDRANQAVLGVFVGVFAYCLVVLRAIRGGDEGVFVPVLAVLVAVVLAFIAIGFFVFFIHHISASIQAANIIDSITHETLAVIARLFPVADDSQEPIAAPVVEQPSPWTPLPAPKTGYIQAMDSKALLKLAEEHGLLIRLEKAIGDFIIEGYTLASIAAAAPIEPALTRELCAAYSIERQRTLHQDAAFGIRQIVDVALKALSPGINDTTTAINCVDFLGAILASLATRRIAACNDGNERLIVACGPTFASLLAESCDQIRQNAANNPAVLVRMLHSLGAIGERTPTLARRHVLRQQVELIVETAERGIPSAHDRLRVLSGAQQILSQLSL